MKKPSHRPERVAELVRKCVAEFLTGEVRDPRIGFVTVTGVAVTSDLSHARVRVSIMGTDQDRDQSLAGLASASRYLRAQLAKELTLRVTPELHFELDKGLQHALRIDRVLKELKEGG